ncbi:3-hydroxyacyl-CoA dehydrogenase NAD-binding domain-containing protein [Euzebya sp.]|uniref:3-hydroxyacyl-CoA dehydrogenase NAD-binding domain-containing protein n=1 Tax=Euzebya sp. TaxID=1971409 RepID=UPI00351988EC
MPDSITRTDRDRVAVLVMDRPGASMNVVDESFLAELTRHVDAVLADDAVDAVVLTSGKEGSFGAGADIGWLPELAARDDAEDFLAGVHDLMLRIARGSTPLVTALNGSAFGGALELALAGHGIVAVPDAQVGLPEVGLSLLPGGGGTQLLSRWVPLETALAWLTSGRPVPVAQAEGVVARVVDPDVLVDEAVDLARSLVRVDLTGDPVHPADAMAVVEGVRRDLSGSRRGLSTAAERILDVVAVGVADGVEAGLAAEREGFLALLRSAEARAALHLFSAESAVKRRSRGGNGPAVTRLGVIGGGQMGAGIASTAVSRGLPALVRDVDEGSLERARGYRDRVLERSAPAEGGDPRLATWSDTTAWEGFAEVDAVVEAVFELPELKTDVLAEVSGLVSPDALVATNTSAIPIASLAGAVEGPERFLGMHFFSPVERMPLVELIPHAGTAPATTERAAAVGRRLGKVPVVVGDAPGFFTSRVYARWLVEGLRLLADGVDVADIDAAARAVGFPVGPLQAIDEATLNLVLQASITQVAEPVMADRLDVAAVRGVAEALIAAGVEGRRQGRGFYTYDQGQRVGPNPDVLDVLGVEPGRAGVGSDAVAERLLLAFATECWRCSDDGTICHPDDGDVAAVLGIGFPRALGGPFHWADEVGATEVVARCAALGDDFGPGGQLGRLAADGGRFADLPRRPAPFADPR